MEAFDMDSNLGGGGIHSHEGHATADEFIVDYFAKAHAMPWISTETKENAGVTPLEKTQLRGRADCPIAVVESRYESLLMRTGFARTTQDSESQKEVALYYDWDDCDIELSEADAEYFDDMINVVRESFLAMDFSDGEIHLLFGFIFDPNTIQDKSGKNLLMCAAESGRGTLVQSLISFRLARVNKGDNCGDQAWVYASRNRHDTIVATLINAGLAEDQSLTSLIYASANGNNELVASLIDEGASVNEKDDDGETALMNASAEGHDTTVAILIDAGAEINAKDYYGNTALIRASLEGHGTTVGILVKAGANMHLVSDGEPALIKAIKYGHCAVVKTLIRAGVEANQIDSSGRTAWDHARDYGSKKILRALRKAK